MIRQFALAALLALPVPATAQTVSGGKEKPNLFGWPARPSIMARDASREDRREDLRPRSAARTPASKTPREAPDLEIGISGEIWTGVVVKF
jgi:hypothetical protein